MGKIFDLYFYTKFPHLVLTFGIKSANFINDVPKNTHLNFIMQSQWIGPDVNPVG